MAVNGYARAAGQHYFIRNGLLRVINVYLPICKVVVSVTEWWVAAVTRVERRAEEWKQV